MNNTDFRWIYFYPGLLEPDALQIGAFHRELHHRVQAGASKPDALVLLHGKDLPLADGMARIVGVDKSHRVDGDNALISAVTFDGPPRIGYGVLLYATGEVSIQPRVWSWKNMDFRVDMDNTSRDQMYMTYRLDPKMKAKLELFHHDWVEGRRSDAINHLYPRSR